MRNAYLAGKWKHIAALSLAIGGGLLIAILNWPYALYDPFTNIPNALQVASKFPQRIPLLFEGKYTSSLEIPWYYAIKWIVMTVPIAILLLFAAGVFYTIINYKKPGVLYYGLIFLAIVSPLIYAIYGKMPLYSSWRHLLFIYPLMVVFAAFLLTKLINRIKGQYQIPVSISICLLLLAHPIYWSIKNHPFEYIYFNETSGGFAKNYNKYETDYWQVAIKEGLEWIYENEHPDKQPGIIISTNAHPVTAYTLNRQFKDTTTEVGFTGLKHLNIVNWQYLLINVIFFNKEDLNSKFPPYGTIHTIDVDGKPVCAIVKRMVRNDYESFEAMKEGNYKLADSLAMEHLKVDPYAEPIYEVAVASKGILEKWESCYKLCQTGLNYFPNNQKILYYYALSHYDRKDLVNAAKYLELAVNSGKPPAKQVYKQLANLFHQIGNDVKAEYYYTLYEK